MRSVRAWRPFLAGKANGAARGPDRRVAERHGADLDLRSRYFGLEAIGLGARIRLEQDKGLGIEPFPGRSARRLRSASGVCPVLPGSTVTTRLERMDEHALENQPAPSVPDDSDDFPGWREEGLFVRDLEGRLIRYDAPTHNELDREVVSDDRLPRDQSPSCRPGHGRAGEP